MGIAGLAATALMTYAVASEGTRDAVATLHELLGLAFLVGIPCALHLATSARRVELRFEPHRLVLLEIPHLGRRRTSELARARVSGARVEPGERKTFFNWVLAVQVGASHPPWRIAGNLWIEKRALEWVAELVRRWAERVPAPAAGGDVGRATAPSLRCPRCASVVPEPDDEQRVRRIRCPACDKRFDATCHRVAAGPFRVALGQDEAGLRWLAAHLGAGLKRVEPRK